MTRGLPNWFRALFTAVMLLLCVVLVSQLIYQTNAQAQIVDLQLKLETGVKRLEKQQLEYANALAELPAVEAELAKAAPLADAAVARKDELKAQCSALTAENAALAVTLSELQAQAKAVNTEFFTDPDHLNQYIEVFDNLSNALDLSTD